MHAINFERLVVRVEEGEEAKRGGKVSRERLCIRTSGLECSVPLVRTARSSCKQYNWIITFFFEREKPRRAWKHYIKDMQVQVITRDSIKYRNNT
jgi:hypothetical protein